MIGNRYRVKEDCFNGIHHLQKDEILTEKVLQKSINDSIMNIDIFITTKENIATLS